MSLSKTEIDENISDVKALIKSGDLDLASSRQLFRKYIGRETTLTEEQLIRYHASEDDDMDDSDRSAAMAEFEKNPV